MLDRALQRVAAILCWTYLTALAVFLALCAGIGERLWVMVPLLYGPRVAFAVPLAFTVPLALAARRPRLLWTQLLAAALVLGPILGLHVLGPLRALRGPPPPRALRVFSYNVWLGMRGLDEIEAELRQAAPDVALLQVVDRRFEPLFTRLRAQGFTVRRDGPFAVASRFPILEVEVGKEAFGPAGPPFVRTRLQTAGGPLEVLNVHPTSPRLGLEILRQLRRRLSGAVATEAELEVDRNVALRESQVRAISRAAARARRTAPLVIAGDFNLPELSALYREFFSAYQDGFAEAGAGFGYTFPATPHSPWMRIDRVLATSELQFTAFSVGGREGSDHCPVVADLAFREGGRP